MSSRIRATRHAVVDTLKISEQDYHRILAQLEEESLEYERHAGQRRAGNRYRHPVQFVLRIAHPGGTAGNFVGRARDVSAQGIGFLHGGFLHAGTRCTVFVPARKGTWLRVEGVVVRCRLIERRVHEIGVKFNQPIEVSTVANFAASSATSESAPAA